MVQMSSYCVDRPALSSVRCTGFVNSTDFGKLGILHGFLHQVSPKLINCKLVVHGWRGGLVVESLRARHVHCEWNCSENAFDMSNLTESLTIF